LKQCADLQVKTVCRKEEDSVEIRTCVRRVYITMIACKTVSKEMSTQLQKARHWKCGDKISVSDLVDEFKSYYPIVYDKEVMTVVEWGGIFLAV